MPYRSQAQAAYFNTHKKQFEAQGVNVSEWNSASEGMNLPLHAGKHKLHKPSHYKGMK